jgi:ketosteroid isomerase-like protein
MQPSPELRQAVLDFYKALDANDLQAITRLQSSAPEALVIGTDDTEWWIGPQQVIDKFGRQLAQQPELTFEPGDVQALEDEGGRVGCFADRVTIRGAGDGAVTARLTGVAVRGEDGWKLLQSHLSVGADA